MALAQMGFANIGLGRYEQARTAIEEDLTLTRDIGHPWLIGLALSILSWLAALRGEYQEAYSLGQESLAIFRRSGATYDANYALATLAEAAIGLGRLDEARQTLIEAMRLALRFRESVTSPGVLL